jgi:hypothetical protein
MIIVDSTHKCNAVAKAMADKIQSLELGAPKDMLAVCFC